MNFTNPTPIKVGMTGTLFGKPYRVAGRVVLGTEEDGEVYYWNEFNLVTTEGEEATLVFEQTEQGPEWRLFVLFEPEYPITAEDAATKRVGDPLNLDGTDVRVTLVSSSRIYHIEGEGAEGEEVGDVARYFNAEAGNTMIVVSWTSGEVECYRGVEKLPYSAVRDAFGLKAGMLDNLGAFRNLARIDSEDTERSGMSWTKPVGALLAVIFAIFAYSVFTPRRQAAPITRISAPASPLKLSRAVKLDGRDFHVQGHDLVEIAEVGLLFERHEYLLSDQDGHNALLVQGMKSGSKDWVLFTPLQPLIPITSLEAAALRTGDTVNVDGYVGPVKELFRSRVCETESAEGTGSKNGAMLYGFTAQSHSTLVLVRWSEGGIAFYAGKPLPAKESAVLK